MSQETGAIALGRAMIIVNYTVLILSKTGDDAKEYLRRLKDMYTTLPEVLRLGVKSTRDSADTIEFINGSRIKSLPANKGAGYTADLVIVDEAAFITKSESKIDLATVLRRVFSTLDKSDGQLILISTANGDNVFKSIYMKAKHGLSGFKPFFISCWDDPTFTKEAREKIVIDFGEDHANQEYPRTDVEAFLSTGRKRFDVKSISWYEERLITPIFRGELHVSTGVMLDNPKGELKIFKKKEKYGQYLLVADVAEGLDKHDYSVLKVFERETWDQVAEWHGHIEPTELGTIMVYLGRFYNNGVLAPEVNNHGVATVSQITKHEHYDLSLLFEHNLISKEQSDDDFRDPVRRYGWHTNRKTRGLILDNLAKCIVDRDVPGFNIWDIEELLSFVIKNSKAQADGSNYDDRVMALAIAYYLLITDTFNCFYPIIQKKQHERCFTCQHMNKNKGRCHRTHRNIEPDDYCILYDEFQFEESDYGIIDNEAYNGYISLTK